MEEIPEDLQSSGAIIVEIQIARLSSIGQMLSRSQGLREGGCLLEEIDQTQLGD